ncbi:MAG: SpoIIE family protein phosphatase [Thermoleophilia bacterium]|nr:SpoIIE family protein phosphatase [Thermoleophilia bacterium]
MTTTVDAARAAGRHGLPAEALATLTRALVAAASRAQLADALHDLAEAARRVADADVAVVRALAPGGVRLEAVAVAAPAPLAAELEGGPLPLDELPREPLDRLDEAPAAVRRAARRAAARSLLLVPIRAEGGAASLELLRGGGPFSVTERLAAELVAAQVGLALRAFADGGAGTGMSLARPALDLAGEALAAALDEAQASAEIVRLAASLVGAPAAILWRPAEDRALAVAASHGVAEGVDLEPARALAERALAEAGAAHAPLAEPLPGRDELTTLPLGRPPLGVLQVVRTEADPLAAEQLDRLATFAVRAAHALRSSSHAQELALELERTRALLAVIGQATSELSVSHTLQTAVDRVAELLAVDRVAVYLRAGEEGGLVPAAVRGVAGPHARLAERLLDLALGPARGRAVVEVADAARDPRVRDVAASVREAGVRGAIAVPLVVREEVIGLLAVYPEGRRAATEDETALLAALAGQLAVAVQNAQLHERATRLGEEREAALHAERGAARRLRALYEVSRSFAQSLSLDETLKALARTVVDVLDVDAAVIRMPDERRELLVPRAVHVKDPHLAEAVQALLDRPTPFGARPWRRLFRSAQPVRIGRGDTRNPGGTGHLLEAFLEQGWTVALVPVAKSGEVIASLSILSCRPGSPIADETLDAAVAIAGQAALAIDNARLYQQQKRFADTMQRSLLPRSRPLVPGLEVGEMYESSARVDVGGDLYDFLALEDGRLAVVLGDVTGHGVDATADMAMAKFVFRSLAREHPEPGAFLAAANDVVVDEIATGKFITMAYLAVDGARGEVACASAGHPAPRLVLPDGVVRGLDAGGLALGIDVGQRYEEVRAELPLGGTLVLYTDGVAEARRGSEQYGIERLDALLAARRELPARALAQALAEDAREFAGGELSDDLAVVVIRRTG